MFGLHACSYFRIVRASEVKLPRPISCDLTHRLDGLGSFNRDVVSIDTHLHISNDNGAISAIHEDTAA